MKIIYKERGKGKTTDLIKECAEHGGYIVCHQEMIGDIMYSANQMKLKINKPLSYNQFLQEKYRGQIIPYFYIDDIDMLLMNITNIKIRTITLSKETTNENNN